MSDEIEELRAQIRLLANVVYDLAELSEYREYGSFIEIVPSKVWDFEARAFIPNPVFAELTAIIHPLEDKE